jgi:hypothetical protein
MYRSKRRKIVASAAARNAASVLPEHIDNRNFPVPSKTRSGTQFPSCSDRGAKALNSLREPFSIANRLGRRTCITFEVSRAFNSC